jgi:hypothetical protein
LQGLKFGSDSDAPAVFTKDGQKMRLPDQPSEGHYTQPYPVAYAEAIQDREHGIEDAMDGMYAFWPSFLVSQFNLTLYTDFKS